jgi:hypothetical protein
VDTLVVDKTGTLTEGRPRLTAVDVADGWNKDEVLRLAAAVERGSEHPLAAAIVGGADAQRLRIPAVTDFTSTTAKGVSGRVEGCQIDLGSVELMRVRGIDPGPLAERADAWRNDRRAGCRRCSVSLRRSAHQPDLGERRDDPELVVGDRKRAAASSPPRSDDRHSQSSDLQRDNPLQARMVTIAVVYS